VGGVEAPLVIAAADAVGSGVVNIGADEGVAVAGNGAEEGATLGAWVDDDGDSEGSVAAVVGAAVAGSAVGGIDVGVEGAAVAGAGTVGAAAVGVITAAPFAEGGEGLPAAQA